MSWSQMYHSKDLSDQQTILVGSAVRLLCGLGGLFVLANEAFDPQSSSEYTLYQLSEEEAALWLSSMREQTQPGPTRPFLCDLVSKEQIAQLSTFLSILEGEIATECTPDLEQCSVFVSDAGGVLGILHYLRPARIHAHLFDQDDNETPLIIAQFAAGLRAALRAQMLVKEQQRLVAIFRQSAEGILCVDAALRIIDFNPSMEHLTGWRESEVLGRFYSEVLRPKDRQGHDLGLQGSPILQVFSGKSVVEREMIIVARDGQQLTVSGTASCIYSVHGEPTIGILTMRDITSELEQEEQRSTFISVISHELQTPIAIIKGYASTLARADATLDRESLRTRLKAVEEEADRLNKLVVNLLYASRIQAGGLQMDITPLEPGPLIERVAERLRVKNPDTEMQLDIPAHLPMVMADRERIEEVLQNLLDNAIKYSPDKAQISVTCRAMGDEVVVSVNDHGMGIPLREQSQIFDRFHRSGGDVSRTIQGAGLGLYICRAIVEAHGGRIRVESTLHSGSTFSFSLPREEKAQLPMVVF